MLVFGGYSDAGCLNDVWALSLPYAVKVAFEFMPQTLNLKSNGKWVTGYLQPPAPYLASQIDISSIRLNGTVPVSAEFRPVIENGDTRLTVKFARAEVGQILTPGTHLPVVATGTIAGRSFSGTDSITVIAPGGHGRLANTTVSPQSIVDVTWEALEDTPAGSVALLSSLDGGSTWAVQADGLPASGSYAWTAPDVAAEQAQLVVGVIHGMDESGPILASELAVSDPFSIMAPAGVAANQAAFALRPQNPTVGPVAIRFSLPSSAPATLAVHDVSGRCVVEREVGSDGPGWHTTRLGDLSTGLYFVRLTQAGRSLSSRLAIIR